MTDRSKRQIDPHSGWRWAVWGGFLLLWSTALVVPDPIGFLRRNAPEGLKLTDLTTFLMAKTLHVTAYAVAAILTGWLRTPNPWRWLLLLFWFLHADATEVAQLYVPGRTGSPRDVALDHCGLIIGMALSWRWWRPASEISANPGHS